jgi:hypothetical protein
MAVYQALTRFMPRAQVCAHFLNRICILVPQQGGKRILGMVESIFHT